MNRTGIPFNIYSRLEMLRIWVTTVLLILSSGWRLEASDQRPVVFESEKIEISIGDKRIRVTGTYRFRNSTSSTRLQGIYYPLPVDSSHLYPDRITVTSGPDTLTHEASPAAIRFKLALPPDSLVVFTVFYDQPCLVNDACYILTTTAVWDRSLDRADFEIRAPQGIVLDWVSYDIDEVAETDGEMIHRFSRQDFMPDMDLCLRWRQDPAQQK